MKKHHLAAIACMALTSISAIRADTIATTDSILGFAPTQNGQSVTLSSFNAALTTQGLNPADYTLTGVTLSFNESSQALVSVFNSGTTSVSFQAATQSLDFSVALSVGNNVVATTASAPIYNGRVTPLAVNPLTTVGVTSSTPAAAGVSTYAPSLPDGPVSASSSVATILAVQLSSWVTSTPTLSINSNGTFDNAGTITGPPGAGSQAFFGGTSATDATVTATYTYQVAPEPSTWALMIAGLGILGFRIRRKSAWLK